MAVLVGMKEICHYSKRSESTILIWIRDMNFPASKIGGGWNSDTELIDRWRKCVIENDGVYTPVNLTERPQLNLKKRKAGRPVKTGKNR